VAQHECKFRICSIRCLESCRLDMPINCLRKMEKATSSINTLTAAFSKSCLVPRYFVAALFCRGALLSLRSFVAALFCRCAHIAVLFCRALKCRRFHYETCSAFLSFLSSTSTMYFNEFRRMSFKLCTDQKENLKKSVMVHLSNSNMLTTTETSITVLVVTATNLEFGN
jgi:hypothetical protein